MAKNSEEIDEKSKKLGKFFRSPSRWAWINPPLNGVALFEPLVKKIISDSDSLKFHGESLAFELQVAIKL